jgi:hypothetical protein
VTADEVERIVAVWQARLGLSHWDIKVRWEKQVDDGHDATIVISEDYDQASVRIQQKDDPESNTRPFSAWSEREANVVIVHELLHVFEIETRRPALALANVLSKTSYEMFWSWYEHGAENWVDRLSIILVDVAGCA